MNDTVLRTRPAPGRGSNNTQIDAMFGEGRTAAATGLSPDEGLESLPTALTELTRYGPTALAERTRLAGARIAPPSPSASRDEPLTAPADSQRNTMRYAMFGALALLLAAALVILIWPSTPTPAAGGNPPPAPALANSQPMPITPAPPVTAADLGAGGLAAALSTADGLLLTIANALSHDLYYKMIDPNAPTARRVMLSKILLLLVALAAAYVASLKMADILFLVSAAFSLAAAGFFPALVLGIFWKRASKWGAVLGMLSGFALTLYYMCTTHPWMRSLFDIKGPIADYTWWGIAPISAGIFGVPLGFAVIIIVSLLTPAPKREVQELVEHVRYPNLKPAR